MQQGSRPSWLLKGGMQTDTARSGVTMMKGCLKHLAQVSGSNLVEPATGPALVHHDDAFH
jgi:hypothetical protein